MKLIIGLGNPGKKYEMTRHNAGFLYADFLRQELGFPSFVLDKKMSAEISSGKINNEKILIVKPQTFMNLSGEAVLKLLQFYKLSHSDIIVIHDDLDIALGKFKVAVSSRSAGHNGVQSIIDVLGTKNFRRIRLGICPIGHIRPIQPEDFVLQDFLPDELAGLSRVFSEVKHSLSKPAIF